MAENMKEEKDIIAGEATEEIKDEEVTETADEEIASEEAEKTAETENSSEEKDASEEEKSEKKFFKKKADKKQDAMKEKIDELEDKVKRQLAEFENFRNRTEKEKTQMFETGAKSVIERILPVVDNFERGLATIPEDEKGSPFADGMDMIYRQLMAELEKMEVKPIEAVGEEFNPELHNAVMQVESDEYESGVVAAELQKGYTYRGQVVRYSMVSVVQ